MYVRKAGLPLRFILQRQGNLMFRLSGDIWKTIHSCQVNMISKFLYTGSFEKFFSSLDKFKILYKELWLLKCNTKYSLL